MIREISSREMSDKKGPSGWVSIAIVAMVFAGYRVLTGSSLTRDAGRAITSSQEVQRQPDDSRGPAEQKNGLASTQGDTPTKGSNLTDLQEQAIGFLAQTICSTRRYDYTPEQAKNKIDYFIKAKDAESIREWMMEPKVANVASTMSMAFNTSCTNFDPESEDAKRAFKLMSNL